MVKVAHGDPSMARSARAVTGTNATPLITGPAAGMAVDCAGNIYVVAERFLRVHFSTGQLLATFTGFEDNISNAAFGGQDARTLLITGRGALYQVRFNLPGRPN